MSFTKLRRIGASETGEVWQASDDSGAIVALKILPATCLRQPAHLARIEHDVRVAATIRSEHVARVLGYGTEDGVPAVAYEYVEGSSLREALDRHGAYSWPQVADMLGQAAAGLAEVHRAGLVRGCLDPSNVLLTADRRVELADVGITPPGLDGGGPASAGTGSAVVSPYVAPEGAINPRSDLYSLGVIAYELLTHMLPSAGPVWPGAPSGPDLGRLPPEARPIVGRLLAERPQDRPRSAAAVVALLAGGDTPAAPATPAAPDAPLHRDPLASWQAMVAAHQAAERGSRARSGVRTPGRPGRTARGLTVAAVVAVVTAVLAASVLSGPGTAPTVGVPTYGVGAIPAHTAEPVAVDAFMARLRAVDFQFGGAVSGSVTLPGSDGEVPSTPLDGTFKLHGDDSALSLNVNQGSMFDPRITPPILDSIAVGDTRYWRTVTRPWQAQLRRPDRLDSIVRAFEDDAGIRDLGLVAWHGMLVRKVGSGRPMAIDPAFLGIGPTTVFGDPAIWLAFLVTDAGDVAGLTIDASWTQRCGQGGCTGGMSLDVVVDALSGVSIDVPSGMPSPEPSVTTTASVTPTPASVTPTPRTTPAPPSTVDRFIDRMNPDFQFAGAVTGSVYVNATQVGAVVGSASTRNGDSSLSIRAGLGNGSLVSETVTIGASFFFKLTGPWHREPRAETGADSLAAVFAGPWYLSEAGATSSPFGGQALHRLEPFGPAALEPGLFGLANGERYVDVFARVTAYWAKDDGTPVGMTIEVTWNAPPGAGVQQTVMTLNVGFDKLTGVTIKAPALP